jgi:ribosomal protein S18 acetylase RimI-like enzyme
MPDATHFARQWAGMVAQVRLFAANSPRATLVEAGGMVASVMPAVPKSSVMNVALAVDPADPPRGLEQLAERFRAGGARKWGLWVDAGDERGALAAREQGMVLDSRPAAMVATLSELPFDHAPERAEPDLPTVGRVNDLAYGYPEPKLAPAIANLPGTVLAYGAAHDGEIASVAMAHDIGTDTAVWLVATLPQAQRRGLAAQVLRRLLLDARERGQETASLQASRAGRPLYERLGFTSVGELHLYEERFG